MAAIRISKLLYSPVLKIWKAPLAHCHSASPISFSHRLIYYQQIAIRLRVHIVGHPSSVFVDSQPISLRGSLSLSSGCSRNRSRTGNPFVQKLMYKSYLDSLEQDDTMAGPVEEETLQKIEEAYQLLNDPDNEDAEKCHSLLKKYLTKDVVDKLKELRTDLGATLWDCIMSGVANLDSGVGIYAPDSESYTKFSDLFYPVIQDYHIGFNLNAGQKHPPADFGIAKANFADLDPTGDFIISTRTRCGRSLAGYPFNPLLNEGQYKEMESKVKAALEGLPGELAGTYYPLLGMTKETQTQLINDHFLFKEGDRFLQAANACRHWPVGRGIFHNAAKTFLVWVNEEDHLRIISMQMGGDLLTVYKRMVAGVSEIEKKLPFSHDDNLGFLTFCPTNLGTTIRASVHIKLPKLSKNMDSFKKVSAEFNLQVRGTHGEHTESEGGVYDVSNKRRMGLTEFDAVKEMYEGIKRLIELEKAA